MSCFGPIKWSVRGAERVRVLYDESLLIACEEDKMREEKRSAAQQDTRDVLDIYVWTAWWLEHYAWSGISMQSSFYIHSLETYFWLLDE